jgi:hypothetical protein
VLKRRLAKPIILIPLTGAVLVVLAAGAYLASPLVIRTSTVEQSPFQPLQSWGEPAIAAPMPERVALDSTADSRESATGDTTGVAAQALGIRRGNFADRDQIHRGRGDAILGDTTEGRTVLRFEGFSVTNGPDLHVFLSRSAHPLSHDDVHNGLYVGKLKASEGAFNYELPPGSDVEAIRSVVVYCVPFRVIFTSAPLG